MQLIIFLREKLSKFNPVYLCPRKHFQAVFHLCLISEEADDVQLGILGQRVVKGFGADGTTVLYLTGVQFRLLSKDIRK